MLNFVLGTVFGIVIATVGFRGIVGNEHLQDVVGGLDSAVETVKNTAENVVSKH